MILCINQKFHGLEREIYINLNMCLNIELTKVVSLS